jgi:indolepyruvate ferredoxin oxidoreductase alpha subunit
MIRTFSESVEKVIVLEELDPFIEDQVRLMGIELYKPAKPINSDYAHTKSIFPIPGELNSAIVRHAAYLAGLINVDIKQEQINLNVPLPARPPTLCPGCPHRSSFYVLSKLKVPVNGDIGCYTLGVAPPLSTIDTCGCMGAGIGVAHGAAVAGDQERHVAVIGDSTFFHTGISALINVAYNRSNVITIIMDNRVTGMTGHQENPGTGFTLQNQATIELDIEKLVLACGIEKVLTV